MTRAPFTGIALVALLLGSLPCGALAEGAAAPPRVVAPLRVVATMPDLGDLARSVGGALVQVTTITKGPEDPHFSQPRPSFIKALSEADVFVLVGMDLEIGYAPVLLRSARNARVLPGAPGYVDASAVIEPLDVPTGTVDRSMGDVHVLGNPHYLLDPVNGLRVADLLRERFSKLRPAQAEHFASGFAELRRRIAVALVGEVLANKYEIEPLMRAADLGRLDRFLADQGDRASLGGWIGQLRPHAGTRLVSDHRLWPYFARRFGFELFADMEPVPGVPPSTRHLQGLVERMREGSVRMIVTAPYYDPRHAQFLADATGSTVVRLAHQTGALPGVDGYLEMVDHNVSSLAATLGAQVPAAIP